MSEATVTLLFSCEGKFFTELQDTVISVKVVNLIRPMADGLARKKRKRRKNAS